MKFVQRKSGVGSVHLNTEPTNEYKSGTNENLIQNFAFLLLKKMRVGKIIYTVSFHLRVVYLGKLELICKWAFSTVNSTREVGNFYKKYSNIFWRYITGLTFEYLASQVLPFSFRILAFAGISRVRCRCVGKLFLPVKAFCDPGTLH